MKYTREFEEIPSVKQAMWMQRRQPLVEKYSWAVPNEAAIEKLVRLSPIVEMGAGNGYWAYEVGRHGGSVHAYDIEPPDNPWTDVTAGDTSVLSGYTEPLLLCWPPYDEDMALDAAMTHAGDTIVYVGEPDGCTANKAFHDHLRFNYECTEIIDIPSYEFVYDNFFVYRKT